MSERTLESHGAFAIPFLHDGLAVLDVGCGPGTITCDIAERIPHGSVIGVDADERQVRKSEENADDRGVRNVSFRTADAYELPFETDSFDVVFAHAVLEHLREPRRALKEFRRVLRPAGTVAVCSPDWGGFLLAPPSDRLHAAVDAYKDLQTRNGGDVYVGRKLASLATQVGFRSVEMKARYEVYDSLQFIGEYLAVQLEDDSDSLNAATFREWATDRDGMFAQAWVSCTGVKPAGLE